MGDGAQTDKRRILQKLQNRLASAGVLQFAPAQEPTSPATHEYSELAR